MVQVVSLAEYRNRELVEVLKGLLALAEDGSAQALGFVVKIGRSHRAALVGDYRRQPGEALRGVLRLKERLLQEEEPAQDSDFGESTL